MKRIHRGIWYLMAAVLLIQTMAVWVLPASASEGLTNCYELVEGSYYYIKDGEEIASPNFLTSGYIAVAPGDTLCLGPCVASQGYQFATFSAAEPSGHIGLIPAAQMTKRATLEDGSGIYSYTVPEGVNYIRMSAAVEYARYFLLTRNQLFNGEGLMDYFGTAAPIVNLYDKNTAEYGYYQDDHSVKGSTSHWSAEEIDVEKDDVLFFGPANTAQNFQLYYWDADDRATMVQANNANLRVVDTFANGQVIYAYRAPGDGQVGIVNASAYNDFFVITKNSPATVPGFYAYWDGRTDGGAYDTITGREEDFEVQDSVLNGKTALFVGDSICYGSQDEAKKSAWAGRIAEHYGLDFYTNNGVSGASLSTARADRQGRILWQVTREAAYQYDYVILHGGVNDAWDSYPVGEVSSSFDVADFDVNTYAGALEELFYYTIRDHGTSAIGYLMNFKAPSCTSGRISDMSEYFAVGKQICEKWKVPYLDMYNSAEITEALKFTTKTYTNDYIHPNAAGYDVLYPFIAEWMETLEPYRAHEAEDREQTVIACVGDSITKGEESSDVNRYSYPAQLQELLGEDYQVLNLGWGGATAQSDTSNPYKRTVQYKQSLFCDPDTVIIMLGTNDTKEANWDTTDPAGSKASFKADLLALVEDYQSLSAQPKVYLATPAWIQSGTPQSIFTNGMIAAIQEVAKEKGCTVIDINAATLDRTDLFNKGSWHPNDAGYRYIAETMLSGLGLTAAEQQPEPETPIEHGAEVPLIRDFRFYPDAEAYRIETVEDATLFGDLIAAGNTFSGKTVYLMNDLDFTGIDFKPWGASTGEIAGNRSPHYDRSFQGTFDGKGHTLSNVNITSMWYGTALFPATSGATIQNLGIASGRIVGHDVVASIVGYGDYGTQIINVWSAADVYAAAESSVQGSAGIASNMRRTGNAVGGGTAETFSLLENVAYYGTLSAVDYMGGLVAWGQSGTNALHAKNLIMGGTIEARSSQKEAAVFIRYGDTVTGVTEDFYAVEGCGGEKHQVDHDYTVLTAEALSGGEAAWTLSAEGGAAWTVQNGYTVPLVGEGSRVWKIMVDETACYTDSTGRLIQQSKLEEAAYWILQGRVITAEAAKLQVFTAEDTLRATVAGDLNADAGFDTADVVCLLRHLNGYDDPAVSLTAADLSGDGALRIYDAVLALQKLAS